MAVKYAKNNFSTLKLTQILTCWDEKSRNKKFLIVCESFAGSKFVIKSLRADSKVLRDKKLDFRNDSK